LNHGRASHKKTRHKESTLRRRRRSFRPEIPSTESHRINERIRVPKVLLIDQNGCKLGIMDTRDALDFARSQGADLIEVAPGARPPVCKIGDYGRMKYDQKKKETVARKARTLQQLKEVKIRPKTDDHDLNFKLKHARRFLRDGNRVKVTMRFRGREHAHHNLGAEKCLDLAKECADLAKIEVRPRMDGRQMMMILAPEA
jgi:translation initiation factor IF-3